MGTKKKILIVDDEVSLCKILMLRLEKKEYDVIVANDGIDGLEKAKSHKPDLIILDLMLPGMFGEEVCRQIRKDKALADTPVIMLTAKSTDVDRIVGRVVGADTYIMKPFDLNKLFVEIERLIDMKCSPLVEETVSLKKQLMVLLKKDALKIGDFRLSSGKTSKYYLDGRIITLTPEGAFLVASIILRSIEGLEIDAVGGPTLGADPITGSIACLSHIHKLPLKTFIVRKAAKGHGMQRQVEGPELKKNSRVVLVDDVATTGKALIEAKLVMDELGVEVCRAIVIVDRDEGAEDNLAKVGVKLESIFKIKDFGL